MPEEIEMIIKGPRSSGKTSVATLLRWTLRDAGCVADVSDDEPIVTIRTAVSVVTTLKPNVTIRTVDA